jgi:hypothetical protein
MLPRTLFAGLTGLALAAGLVSAGAQQPMDSDNDPRAGNPGAGAPDTGTKDLPQEIQKRLQSEGYSDIKIEPASYLVSAKDKEGNSFVILIGPNSMTMLSMERSKDAPGSSDPSIAEQKPDTRDKLIFQ